MCSICVITEKILWIISRRTWLRSNCCCVEGGHLQSSEHRREVTHTGSSLLPLMPFPSTLIQHSYYISLCVIWTWLFCFSLLFFCPYWGWFMKRMRVHGNLMLSSANQKFLFPLVPFEFLIICIYFLLKNK